MLVLGYKKIKPVLEALGGITSLRKVEISEKYMLGHFWPNQPKSVKKKTPKTAIFRGTYDEQSSKVVHHKICQENIFFHFLEQHF